MTGRGRVKRGLRRNAAVAGAVLLVLVSMVMLFVPAATPRRLVAGLLQAGDPTSATSPESPSGACALAAYQQGYASRYPGLELTIILTEAGASVTPTMPNFVPLR